MLAHADARIGELLAALERLDLTDDTLVIFSSDNGPENTGPPSRRNVDDESTGPGLGSFASVGTTGGHRGRKRSLLQGGIGVPFIARWPGKIAAGKIDDTTPITAVDLLPTFCDIAGVELPEGYVPDGVNQLPALLGTPGSQRKKPIFWQWQTASKRRRQLAGSGRSRRRRGNCCSAKRRSRSNCSDSRAIVSKRDNLRDEYAGRSPTAERC